jgi:hypothetical protein
MIRSKEKPIDSNELRDTLECWRVVAHGVVVEVFEVL